jgi:pimeloyl-ACP methyl ester carboxylesterase
MVLRGFLEANFHPADDPVRKARILERALAASQRLVVETWDDVFSTDTDALAAACPVPALYLDGGAPNSDLARFQRLCPQLTWGRTVGAGHWHQLEVPEQVNAMIERFLAMSLQPEMAA